MHSDLHLEFTLQYLQHPKIFFVEAAELHEISSYKAFVTFKINCKGYLELGNVSLIFASNNRRAIKKMLKKYVK